MIRADLSSWCRAVAACAIWMLGASAHAGFPDKPINLVVAFPAGGGVDVVGRTIAQSLALHLKTSVVVDNRTGASGAIGAQYVKRAAPDGYTLLMAPTTSYVMSEKMVGTDVTGYEMAKDFKPVATVGELPLVMLVSKQSGMTSYADLATQARKNPGKLAYGSSGNGSTEHIVTEWFKQQAGLDLLHVPYRGSAPAMADLFADQIQIMVTTSPTALTNLASGRVTALGVASAQRLAVMPDVPTFAEQGLPQFVAASVYAVLAPKGTPDDIVAALNAALNGVLNDDATQRRFAQLGVQVIHSTPAQARELLQNESNKWERVVQPLKAAAR
ncbi:Bug family tripartite tricarboxylate transporter substrate binding protein [Variovorax ginsengisoli]|uniref:Tripartite-type tricarboxylate transporter receptor subunit TctC n=1 Tax=Variovorax ginsengisoli TaxID=363844 RepID=A0ABT9SEP4_9BURK|nr:tripartite tricarboxylate transporter substrate binding protein [Variovorax ginsengisoli]MDP9902834.1 tripartite-type tricarboxylate transporter receptor subunit TctC [Variovorax ginsengisoli]